MTESFTGIPSALNTATPKDEAIIPAIETDCAQCAGFGMVLDPEIEHWAYAFRAAYRRSRGSRVERLTRAAVEARTAPAVRMVPCRDCEGLGTHLTPLGSRILSAIRRRNPDATS